MTGRFAYTCYINLYDCGLPIYGIYLLFCYPKTDTLGIQIKIDKPIRKYNHKNKYYNNISINYFSNFMTFGDQTNILSEDALIINTHFGIIIKLHEAHYNCILRTGRPY